MKLPDTWRYFDGLVNYIESIPDKWQERLAVLIASAPTLQAPTSMSLTEESLVLAWDNNEIHVHVSIYAAEMSWYATDDDQSYGGDELTPDVYKFIQRVR